MPETEIKVVVSTDNEKGKEQLPATTHSRIAHEFQELPEEIIGEGLIYVPALLYLAEKVSGAFGHDEYAQMVFASVLKRLAQTDYNVVYNLLRRINGQGLDQGLFENIAQALGKDSPSPTASEMAAKA